jgi:hypothetical protein
MDITQFSQAELTAAINKIPVQWGSVSNLGLFKDRGTRTNQIIVEDRQGTLGVLPSHAWGGSGTVNEVDTRHTYAFAIPQTVHNDMLLPSDVMGIRGFGTEALATMAQELAYRLQRMKAKHDITLEHKRINALKGRVLNADGTSVIVDLFGSFGITQQTVNFNLDVATTKVLDKCAEVRNIIEDNLMGDSMTSIRVLVSPEFYSVFIAHANVTKAYAGYVDAANRLGEDNRQGFTFGGITFQEYRGGVNGNRFITAGEGHAFPEGTLDTFATYFAPADFNETVNTMGRAFYAKQWEAEGGRGIVLHTQCNSLPICHQPAVLVKVLAA